MKTIKFNDTELMLIEFGGVTTVTNRLILDIIKESRTVEEIAEIGTGCADIIITETDGSGDVVDIRHFYGFSKFERAIYLKDYIIGDDEGEGEPEPITAEIVELTLLGEDTLDKMQSEIDKNTADIDYIAMESGIDLEG